MTLKFVFRIGPPSFVICMLTEVTGRTKLLAFHFTEPKRFVCSGRDAVRYAEKKVFCYRNVYNSKRDLTSKRYVPSLLIITIIVA